jgi:hypothetical protein
MSSAEFNAALAKFDTTPKANDMALASINTHKLNTEKQYISIMGNIQKEIARPEKWVNGVFSVTIRCQALYIDEKDAEYKLMVSKLPNYEFRLYVDDDDNLAKLTVSYTGSVPSKSR